MGIPKLHLRLLPYLLVLLPFFGLGQFNVEPEASIEFETVSVEYQAKHIDCDNNLLYIGTEDDTIMVLNAFPPYNLIDIISNDNLNGGMGGPFLSEISAVLFHEGRLFIVDYDLGAISIFDRNTLALLNTITLGFGGGGLGDLEGAVIHNNYLFVADWGNDNIEVFNALPPFNPVAVLSPGNGPLHPKVIDDLLYIPIYFENRISIHSTTYPFGVVGNITNAELGNRLNSPSSVQIFNGYLLVSNFGGDNIEVFENSPPYDHVTTLDMGFSGTNFNGVGPMKIFNNRLFVVNYFESANDLEVFQILSPIVPTLSEWGLIVLAISLGILGIVALRNKAIENSLSSY